MRTLEFESLGNGDARNDNRLKWTVLLTGWNCDDCVDNVAAGLICNFTEDGVLEVQPCGRDDGDEEL